MTEHFFTTYVRTKTIYQSRLKDLQRYDTVKIHLYELKKLGLLSGKILYDLRSQGQIWYDDYGNFKALGDGPVDPALLELTKKFYRVKAPLTDLHVYMRDQLMQVSLDVPVSEIPIYFRTFLELRDKYLDTFFTVDSFSGRVHTPVCSLKVCFRRSLRFNNDKIVSLDVKQMQPTVLAKILLSCVGDNPFSDAVSKGQDVYVLLQQQNESVKNRGEAKKFLFQMIFGKPMDDVGRMFTGDVRWVDWINSYKSRDEPRNPHRRNRHTNLAWLLQYSEVKVMSKIWEGLRQRKIPFLTIHDDILCQENKIVIVEKIMRSVLTSEFPYFEITKTFYP